MADRITALTPSPPSSSPPFYSCLGSKGTRVFSPRSQARLAAVVVSNAGVIVMSRFLLSESGAGRNIDRRKHLSRYSNPLHARRKTAADKVGIEDDQLDEDLRTGLNEMATEAVKVMLSDSKKLVNAFKEKVEETRKYLVNEGHSEAATFMVVVKGMLDHKVIPEKDELKGAYKEAFEKVWAVVEDSGWLLTLPDGISAVETVDEELIPPVLETRY